MAPKGQGCALRVDGATAAALLSFKATLLRFGADLALPAGAGGCARETPGAADAVFSALVLGSEAALRKTCEAAEPEAAALAAAVRATLQQAKRGPSCLRARDRAWELGGRTLVLGILNRTPDSFTDRGKHFAEDVALRRAEEMIREGVDILEVGGQTAQPDRPDVSVGEEIERVAPFLARLHNEFGHPLAVDTFRYPVAAAAVEAGACLINDISGLADERLAVLARDSGAALVVMHIRNRPRIDFHQPAHRWSLEYDSVVDRVVEYLAGRTAVARDLGVPAEQIVTDPGLGFDKLYEDDLAIMRRLPEVRALGYPLLLATSHKNYLTEALGEPGLDSDGPTAAAVVWGVTQGADLVRVHDTGSLRPLVRLAEYFAGRADPPPARRTFDAN